MKMKILIAALLLATVGLGIYLRLTQKKAEEQKQTAEASIMLLSTDLQKTNERLAEQQSVNTILKTNLAILSAEAEGLTNKLVSTVSTLAKLEAESKAAAEAAAAEIARREARIKELESTNDGLTKGMSELTNAIFGLEGKINETQRKLAQSEGDRDFLLKELKRLQAEKAELERQFHDMAVLREQVRKLKEELSISKRLEWIRQGLYGAAGLKGAALLQRGFVRPVTPASNATAPSLNVELKTDGTVKAVTPTNTPAPPIITPPPAPAPIPVPPPVTAPTPAPAPAPAPTVPAGPDLTPTPPTIPPTPAPTPK